MWVASPDTPAGSELEEEATGSAAAKYVLGKCAWLQDLLDVEPYLPAECKL